MTEPEIIEASRQFILTGFTGEATGHDYFHVARVAKVAVQIAKEENADVFITELAAWMHDVGDYKLNSGIDKSAVLISEFLCSLNLDKDVIKKIITIVSQVSYSKGNIAESLEARIVQDADRLDAIGAIGVARAFAYGGSKLREIYNPHNPSQTSVQHFYDKLLKLKDLMNTPAAKKIAVQRHQFLIDYLDRFYAEWDGEA